MRTLKSVYVEVLKEVDWSQQRQQLQRPELPQQPQQPQQIQQQPKSWAGVDPNLPAYQPPPQAPTLSPIENEFGMKDYDLNDIAKYAVAQFKRAPQVAHQWLQSITARLSDPETQQLQALIKKYNIDLDT